MVLHCIFEPFQEKAHYERVMETKVLGPITATESELTRLQQLHQVIDV
jgi:structural maintenance of chromosomes protein 6